MKKELVFSVTKKDLDITFYKGSGPGGQKRNKTETACRIHHRDSGVTVTAQEHRTQLENKRAAFLRLTEHPRFQAWYKLEVARRLAGRQSAEAEVAAMLAPQHIKEEVFINGKWETLDDGGSSAPL